MSDPIDNDKPEEIEARMHAALKRALATPPKPHVPIGRVATPSQPATGQGPASGGNRSKR